MPTVNIQQREVPPERFGRLAEYDGPANSVADIQQFIDQHGYVLLRQTLDRDKVMAARQEVLSRLHAVGEVQDPAIEGKVTWKSQRPDPATDDAVFCDDCNQWCGRTQDAARFGLPEDETALQELRPDNLNPLLALQPADPAAESSLQVDTWKCDSCGDTAALQLKLCAMVPDENGKLEEKSEDLTPSWSVTSATLDEINNAGNETPQESPDAG